MELRDLLVTVSNGDGLERPLDQIPRSIEIDHSQCEASTALDDVHSSPVTLLCFDIHLTRESTDARACIFKNVQPSHRWYDMNIRDGDRLLTIDGKEIRHMTLEKIRSAMIETTKPYVCEIIWHPELYIDLCTAMAKKAGQANTHYPIVNGLPMYIRHLLDCRPKEPEKLSATLFEAVQKESTETPSDSYSFAQRQWAMLSDRSTMETMPNILQVNELFERIGVGLNREEMYGIWLLIKALLKEKKNIRKIRFWGKIFGMEKNYYIAEVDLDAFDEVETDDSEFHKYQDADTIEMNANRKVPPEGLGEGVNQKLFYVSNGITEPFVQLPLLTPEQIQLSRQIQRFFVGDLDAPVLSGSRSIFPGLEKHLLRAQIQRISAATQIAPKDYFQLPGTDEEEMGEEENAGTIDQHPLSLEINREFGGNRLENLASADGEYWSHCTSYIYEQGRNVVYTFSPEHAEEEEDEEEQQPRKVLRMPVKPDPPLLSPVNQDATIGDLYPAWSVNIASTLVPEHALVSVRSNRWPGAFTVGDRQRFQTIYIGWGLKTFDESHQANLIDSPPKRECEDDLLELDDPTVDQDTALPQSSILLSPDIDEEFEENIENE